MNPACLRTLCVASVLAMLAPAAAAAYKITEVTRDGFESVEFWGINNAGLIAGDVHNGDSSIQMGFIYDSHTRLFTDLTGPAGAVGAYAMDISDTGVVVGAYNTSSLPVPGRGIGFIYEGGHYTDFIVPGASFTEVRGISGDARYLSGMYGDVNYQFFGFVFDRQTGTLINLGERAIVNGINGHGVVAGSILGTGRTPFLYDIATGVRTDYLPESDRYRDINDAGVVTGWGLRDGFDREVALVGSPGNMAALNVASSYGTLALGINNDGTVVGQFFIEEYGSATGAFIATSVPEPATWALMLCGVLGLAATRHRKDNWN